MISVPDLSSAGFKADPFPFYAQARRDLPVFTMRWVFGRTAYVVTRYDDAVTVLKDPRFSKNFIPKIPFLPRSVRVLMRNLLSSDPPDHTRLRALVSHAFTPKMAERLQDRLQSSCNDLLDAAARKGSVDLVSDFAVPFPLTTIADLLGIPADDRAQFALGTRKQAGDWNRLTGFLRSLRNMSQFVRYLRELIELRRAEPREDLVTALVQAEAAGDQLNEDELVAMIGLLLFAGFQTTVNVIGSGTLALLRDPAQAELLRSGAGATAADELLRYTSPGDISTARVARADIVLSGVRVPRGAFVMASLASANRDESQFRDPDRLDLTRDPNRHLAFGMGPHACMGAPLAKLEVQIALTTLFRRFPNLRLAATPESLRWRKGLALRGLEELPVIF
ncbi:MAG: cytochrome P450 [Thermoanaerobaculia bacterium]